MILTFEQLQLLLSQGYDVSVHADGSFDVSKRKSGRAEANRRYYEKKALKPTEKVLIPTESTEREESPLPSPLSPLHPPIPASPHPPTTPRARESRRSKLDLAESDAREANQQDIPLELNCDGFPAMWAEWCDYRTELQRRKPEKAWTARAARSCLKECAEHGAKNSVQAITNSISNSWQGLIWDRVGAARGSPPAKQSMRNDHPQQEYIPLPEL